MGFSALVAIRGAVSGFGRARAAQVTISALVFLGVFALYWASPVVQSADSRWSLHVAESIVNEGNTDLDEYGDLISDNDRRVERIGSHTFSAFPIGTPLVATPFVYAYDRILSRTGAGIEAVYLQAERLVASFVTALAAGVLYHAFRSHLDTKRALALTLVFAFCTPAWSTASRSLWQHGPSMLMLSIALSLVTLAQRRPWLVQYAGIPLACAYVIRPTNSISVLFLTVYVLVAHRKYILRTLLLAALVALPFLLYNWRTYGALLSAYYMPGRIGSNARFFEALAGNLVSPARGLLVFTPVCLLAPVGIYLKWRKGRLDTLDVILCLIVVVHWIVISSFPHWWAGHSYGPRFFSDVMPYLVYLMIPALAQVGRPAGAGQMTYVVSVAVLVATSAFVHWSGATQQATYEWNDRPISVDAIPSRLWDPYDLQFLRGQAWIDRYVPPRVVLEPARVLLLKQSGEGGEDHVGLAITNLRYRAFRWTASAPEGVRLSATRGEGEERYVLQVTVPAISDPAGTYRLGEIEIAAHSESGRSEKGDRVSVPIDVQVVDEFHQVYCPLVVKGFKEEF